MRSRPPIETAPLLVAKEQNVAEAPWRLGHACQRRRAPWISRLSEQLAQGAPGDRRGARSARRQRDPAREPRDPPNERHELIVPRRRLLGSGRVMPSRGSARKLAPERPGQATPRPAHQHVPWFRPYPLRAGAGRGSTDNGAGPLCVRTRSEYRSRAGGCGLLAGVVVPGSDSTIAAPLAGPQSRYRHDRGASRPDLPARPRVPRTRHPLHEVLALLQSRRKQRQGADAMTRISSRTPTSRGRSAAAGRRVRARGPPPEVGRVATGTRLSPHARPRLPARRRARP